LLPALPDSEASGGDDDEREHKMKLRRQEERVLDTSENTQQEKEEETRKMQSPTRLMSSQPARSSSQRSRRPAVALAQRSVQYSQTQTLPIAQSGPDDIVLDAPPPTTITAQHRGNEALIIRGKRLTVHFDGACRGNHLRTEANRATSFAVFVERYESWPTLGITSELKTSHAAELSAATCAADAVLQVSEEMLHTGYDPTLVEFTIRGDSMSIITAIVGGSIRSYRRDPRMENSNLWVTLREKLDKMADGSLNVKWEWVPRTRNQEADEICNAVLDGRSINGDVRSSPPTATINGELIARLLETAVLHRFPVIRKMPIMLQMNFNAFIYSILRNDHCQQADSRALFMVAPILASIDSCGRVRRGREEAKHLRQHLDMLAFSTEYLVETIQRIISVRDQPPSTEPFSPQPRDPEARIRALASRGEFRKIIPDEDVILADPTDGVVMDKLRFMFPDQPLPSKLPEDRCRQTVTFTDIAAAMRRLKRAKSPGITGWTAETLRPVVFGAPTHLHAAIVDIFTALLNVDVTNAEKSLMTAGVLIPFTYVDKQGKIRPIVLICAVVKVCWYILLEDYKNPCIARTGIAHTEARGCASAVAVIQHSIRQGHPVVACDATNAFNTVSRNTAFAHFSTHANTYQRMFRFMNLMYAEPRQLRVFRGTLVGQVMSTTGTVQGCPSSQMFFTAGITEAAMLAKYDAVNIVDDVHLIGPDAIKNASRIFGYYQNANQHLDGSKLRILWPNARPKAVSRLPACLQRPPASDGTLAHIITTGLVRVLGSYVELTPPTAEQERSFLEDFLAKPRRRLERVLRLTTTLQIKLLVLNAIVWDYVYHAEALAVSDALRQRAFDALDELHLTAFFTLFDIPAADRDSLVPTVQASYADGGFGLLPYGKLHGMIRHRGYQRVREFGARFEIDFPALRADEPAPSIVDAWRKEFRQHLSTGRKTYLTVEHFTYLDPSFRPWPTVWPTNCYTRLDDTTMRFGVHLRLEMLEKKHHWCKIEERFLDGLPTRADFTKHMLTCRSCGPLQESYRHERVVHAIAATLRFYGIAVRVGTQGLALPGRDKGGPDLSVAAGENFIVDVGTVSSKPPHRQENGCRSAMTDTWSMKMNKYADFIKLLDGTGTRFLPFIVATSGVIFEKTLAVIKQWFEWSGRKTACKRDLESNIQMEMLRGMSQGMAMTFVKAQLNDSLTARTGAALNVCDNETLTDDDAEADDDREEMTRPRRTQQKEQTKPTTKTKKGSKSQRQRDGEDEDETGDDGDDEGEKKRTRHKAAAARKRDRERARET
jgi:ribonuclease HI